MSSPTHSSSSIVAAVQNTYNQKAKANVGDTRDSNLNALSVGYTPTDLEIIPSRAKLGVGCGSPVTAANLTEGETVLDLGSGGGIDTLLAFSKVGPSGQAIGIDMSPDMISLARSNATEKGWHPPQVAFIQSSLTDPLTAILSDSIDCVLSNCVINLLPPEGKRGIYTEIYRMLKPGGRIVIDDTIAKKPLDSEIQNNLNAYVNCISGAVSVEEHEMYLNDAGFTNVSLVATNNNLETICSSCRFPPSLNGGGGGGDTVKHSFNVNEWIASYQIKATKPPRGEAEKQATVLPSALSRWWDAYPKAKSTPLQLQQDELFDLMTGKGGGGGFAVIDVRRDDHGGGHVRGSDNWPAQTFHDDLPQFLQKYRNTERVVFYCGSSAGRGPRCAGWYQDFLDENGVTASKAYVLVGGVKAWIEKHGDDESLVDRD